MKKQIALHCIAPDGEFITEGREFPAIESAWNRNENMGSRWIFYPIHVVTTAGKAAIIRDVPHGMVKEWIGKRLSSLIKAMKERGEDATNYANGDAPFHVYP